MRLCATHNDSNRRKQALLKTALKFKIEDDGKLIRIGTIFHIMLPNYDRSKVEEDVKYTLEMLNKDYNKAGDNFDAGRNVYLKPSLKKIYQNYVELAEACNLEFYLVDLKYNPVPPQTSSNISILDKNIKEVSPAIEPRRYLNIWVADLESGLLGYAQFPWELDGRPETDGVVIGLDTFGKTPKSTVFNLNKTLTHEVGHWLGLYHVFQDTFDYEGGNIDYLEEDNPQELKGDCVADTPPQKNPTYGNPFKNPNLWPSSRADDETKRYPHMFMNFMDYTDDLALFMFTKQQVAKIRLMIHLYRPEILQNDLKLLPPIESSGEITSTETSETLATSATSETLATSETSLTSVTSTIPADPVTSVTQTAPVVQSDKRNEILIQLKNLLKSLLALIETISD